jgi:CHAT domain-containing protein
LAEARAQLLDEKTYIVEFFMGEENFFLWVISKDKVLWSQSFRCEQKFFEKIANFQSQIAQHKINLDFQLGKDIYDLLLKDALKQVPLASHLVIIPDGLLLRLPFEALVKDFDGRAPKYLLEYYPISYAPSASVLAEVKKYHRRGSGPSLDLLALGNPVIEDKGEANKATVENLRAGGVHLLPLPYAEDEVFSINQIYKKNGKTAEFYVKEKALEEVIKSRETSQSKTLHFATHGFIDDRVPALSGLLLAPSQDPRGDDGFLRLNEIFQLKLNADLVTLSACETALGKEVRGEGMIGLTRAFFYAGASSIMASLWMVSDQSTAILMKDFYSHYIRGERASTALRQAKLNMLKNNDQSYRHPFFWAPFIIMGSYE